MNETAFEVKQSVAGVIKYIVIPQHYWSKVSSKFNKVDNAPPIQVSAALLANILYAKPTVKQFEALVAEIKQVRKNALKGAPVVAPVAKVAEAAVEAE